MTKAQELGITEFPYHEYDELGRITYWEYTNGFWSKRNYIDNKIFQNDSHGYWDKFEYDKLGNVIFFEDSSGYWEKAEYDIYNNILCVEYSNGKGFFNIYENNKIIKVLYEDVKSHLRDYRLEQLLK
jgi:hypothetical protein